MKKSLLKDWVDTNNLKIDKNISIRDLYTSYVCSLFDNGEFSDAIYEKQGKKQKKQGFKGFFSWLDQYI